jgi:hypothetical protein
LAKSADDQVKLNIGVPGNIARGTVRRGTPVRKAITKFGFGAGAHEIRGWTPGGDKQSKPMTLDDKIESDMTVLLLRSIVGQAAPEQVIEDVVRENLGMIGVRDVFVQPFDDFGEGDSLRVTVVLDPRTAEKLDGKTALDLIVALRRKLEDMEDPRFPVVEYATRTEIESTAVAQ